VCVCVCVCVCILLPVAAVTYQSMERGFWNFGNSLKMIMEFRMPIVIKIFSWLWGLSPYKPYPKGQHYRVAGEILELQGQRRTTICQVSDVWASSLICSKNKQMTEKILRGVPSGNNNQQYWILIDNNR